jgi:hypothetical protein
MRKRLLWACVGLVAGVAGVGCWVGDYACAHPDSWLGRCLLATHELALSQGGGVALEVSGKVAESAARGVHHVWHGGPGAACDEGNGCPKADAPPAEEPVEMAPAVLPGGFVHEEEPGDMLPAEPMPPVRDLLGGLPWIGAVEDSEPAAMPPAEEDAPRMPRAEEAGCREETGTQPEPVPAPHEEVCPCPPRTIKGRPTPGGNEECEPVLPKMQRDGGEKPTHPDVDTMEVRPSDLRFSDLTGPF